ncbi:MAG: alkaline phosphatase family protein [Candidatus Sulfotelmatobacter sp.]
MTKKAGILCLFAVALLSTAFAQEGAVPKGVRHLDHVYVIMMENHAYAQIVKNLDAPFVNQYIKHANYATNYFAVGHPSLTNYLEVVGGSNFGVRTDNSPDWHDMSCSPNLSTGFVSTDNPPTPNICPISGTGTDAATPAIDYTNETTGPPGDIDINGVLSYAANPNTVGITIADELVAAGLSWKTYQEDLPPTGPDTVNNADGFFTNNTDLTTALPGESTSLIGLYAVKHNPFAYFANIQAGSNPRNSYKNMVSFTGPTGLFADLSSGHLPAYSYIVPNQCHDQHGRGNAGPDCEYDPNDNGTQVGLNPALIYDGDAALEQIVNAIHHSPAWRDGRSAIITVWDENDYSVAPTTNKVLLIVDTNYGNHGKQSSEFYTHFSLLKSVEAAFSLPCLNHACDSSTNVMSDLLGKDDDYR